MRPPFFHKIRMKYSLNSNSESYQSIKLIKHINERIIINFTVITKYIIASIEVLNSKQILRNM